MRRNWIEYNQGPLRALRDEVYASINYRYSIVFNNKAYDEMNRPEAVVLLFDADNDTIGLRPARPQDLNAFRIRPKGPSMHRTITAAAFARKHDIRIEGTMRFCTAAVEDGILVLDLHYIVPVKGTPRGGRRKRR
jgi:hypothetical protein